MAQWRALGEKAEADLHDTSGTSVAGFDVGTPLVTSSITQTPSRRPPDTPQTPSRPLFMAQWRALGQKSEADLRDTSGTLFACFDVVTLLATSSITQTLSRRPTDTPQTHS